MLEISNVFRSDRESPSLLEPKTHAEQYKWRRCADAYVERAGVVLLADERLLALARLEQQARSTRASRARSAASRACPQRSRAYESPGTDPPRSALRTLVVQPGHRGYE